MYLKNLFFQYQNTQFLPYTFAVNKTTHLFVLAKTKKVLPSHINLFLVQNQNKISIVEAKTTHNQQ